MSAVSRDYPVLVGAAGWPHPGWRETFFPDDLPAEWEPIYYANEFPVLLLPLAALEGSAGEAWAEAAETGLRLLVETSAGVDSAASLAAFGEALAGVVVPARALAGWADAPWPVVADFGAAGPAPAEAADLAARGIGWCWHGEGEPAGLEHGPLAVIRAPAAGADPRTLRRWLEAGLAVQDGRRTVALILDGAPPPVEILRQAQTLLELM